MPASRRACSATSRFTLTLTSTLTLALLACGPSEEAVESARVLHAIDAVRAAPSPEDVDAGALVSQAIDARRRLLDALERTVATRPDTQRARDTCAATYRNLVDGAELRIGVQAELAKGTEPSPELVRRLLDAEARINRSAALLPDCERAAANLRARARR